MKKLGLLLTLLVSGMLAWAQNYPQVTIQQIQTVSQPALANCVDTAAYMGDTVTVTGTVVMNGGLAQSASGRQIWIQSGTGPWSGIDIRFGGGNVPTTPDDILDLVAGDSVEITGFIEDFSGETQLNPISVSVIQPANIPVAANPVAVADLNNSARINQIATGEQWEGTYVELYNVTVATVDPFSGNTRVSFYVQDQAGNQVNISDRFLAQRLPASGGTFVPPSVGTVFDTIRGVVAHSENGCTGSTGRGYEIFPFSSADYIVQQGASAPLISGITRNPVVPTSSQDVTIFATIEDVDGTVTSATLHYAVGTSNNTYLTLPMTSSGGSTYSATISATNYSDGDFVKYYISAIDNDNLTASNPSVVGSNANPLFFTARDAGATIYDIQYTPFPNGNSGYLGLEMTVEGIVTASAQNNDLGYVYIQEAGKTSWAGLGLVQNASLATLNRGDKVSVRGTIQEDFGNTRMVVLDVNVISSNNPVPDAVSVSPSIFSTYDFQLNEKYESMLLSMENPSGKGIYIVDWNADATDPDTLPNFAEFRIGNDEFDPNTGSRVLVGRQTSTSFSSLYTGYINSSFWLSNSGIINVPTCVVEDGDTMTSVTGIMTYTFSNMKLLPRNTADFENYSGQNCPNGVTGISKEAVNSSVKVFPNPAGDLVNMSFSLSRNQQTTWRLFDLMGREVARESLRGQEGSTTLDISNFVSGIYVWKLEGETGVLAQGKLQVQ